MEKVSVTITTDTPIRIQVTRDNGAGLTKLLKDIKESAGGGESCKGQESVDCRRVALKV